MGIKRETKSLTYNVQQIGGDEVAKAKDMNVMSSLAGKVAGVNINASSSGIGGGARVVMRGTKSISGNNNALYVVDGVPLANISGEQPDDQYTGAGQSGDGLANFNADDIESISVLSGSAAAGEWYSWASKLSSPTDYEVKDFFQTGYNVANTVSLTTGTQKNQTYVSVGAVNARGIIQNNDLDRYNFSVRNTTSMLNDKLTMDLSFMYSNVKEQNMLSQGEYANPLVPVYLFPRGDDFSKYQYYERYDVDRNIKTQFWPLKENGLSMQNPYWITNRNMYTNKKDRFLASGSLKYDNRLVECFRTRETG